MNDWKEITSNEALHLSQAEFQGMTIQAMQDMREDIKDLKRHREIREYITYAFAILAGIISGQFKLK